MNKSYIDSLDKIRLSHDDIDLLFEWRDNHKDYVREFKPVLNKGVIEISDTIKEIFHDDGKVVVYEMYSRIKGEFVKTYTLAWDKETKIGKRIYSLLKDDVNEHEYNESIISTHASLMAYMEYYGDKKEYVDVKRSTVQVSSKYKKSKSVKNKKSKKSVKIKRKVYNIKVDKNATIVDKRMYKRHMDKWTQKGHWRTYKSGKRVWIKPMVKGKGKDVTPKEYKM